MKKKYLIIPTVCLLLSSGLNAQVTIGSGQKPNTGTLLDLKEEADGSSKKGMVLPRVKLMDVDALTMGTNAIPNASNAWTAHTGLIVYNVSGITPAKCAPIPDGLYVWDGAKWNGINTPTPLHPPTLDVGTKTTFDFPSGIDLRPLAAQSFTATWTPTDKPVIYTNTPHATFGGVSFSVGNIPASPLTTSPASFSMTPDAMTPAEITANPFRTKESTLKFDVAANECYPAQSQTITLNQTNKALTLATTSYDYPTAGAKSNTLQSNSNWKLASIMPADATNAISNVRVAGANLPIGTTQAGYEQNNNAGKAATLTYDIAVNSTRSRYSTLTFADASATKRFSDVTITVLQCTNVGISPTIEQWALIAGFTQTQVNAVKTTGTDSPILATGIQLHRDQSNNLFLSSSFHATDITGTTHTDRWMIHNLAAEHFVGDADRTGDDKLVLQAFSTSPSGANNYLTPLWAYPKAPGAITVGEAASTEFTNNPRLGRLYNWAAATNSRGGTTDGQNAITDGENVTIARPTIQGICPDGWHLPSDVEWTTLEQELATNTSRYSSTPNVGGTIAIGGTGYRGTTHGKAMKEICEPYTLTHQGTSNGITSDRPGFDLLLAGDASSGSAINFGTYGYLWSASGGGTNSAWCRIVHSGGSQVFRNAYLRAALFSVRCKK